MLNIHPMSHTIRTFHLPHQQCLTFAALAFLVLALFAVPAQAENRSVDGSGNNLLHPTYGAASTMYARWGEACYDDGMNSPGGVTRANPRTISNAIATQTGDMPNRNGLSDYAWQWGQFIDHDINLTNTHASEPMVIHVPDTNDILFPAIPTSRSNFHPTTGTTLANPRQQINSITSFIDGSMVYGSDALRAATLRSFNNGRLATGAGNMLPKNTAGLPNANDIHAEPTSLYLAGDVRANVVPGLTALHTLFMREHNRIADALSIENPGWTDEMLYQRARKIVGAEIQAITYNEYLPALLGSEAPSANGPGYDPTINPAISNEFATALFRIGHTEVSNTVARYQNNGSPSTRGHLTVMEAYFNPSVMADSTDMNEVLKGLAVQRMQEIDTRIVDSLRNNLFGPAGGGGLDLAALNIMRGRGHGLDDYNSTREHLGLARVNSFDEITSDAALAAELATLYGNDVDNIDLWIGVLAEDHLPGSSVGETMARGLARQFTNLRDGDRFFYEYDADFSPAELLELQATRLSDIIRRNTGITNIQENVFFAANAVPEPAAWFLFTVCSLAVVGRLGYSKRQSGVGRNSTA